MNLLFPAPGSPSDPIVSFEEWRARFLQTVLQGTSILGFAAVAAYLFASSPPLYKILVVAAYTVLAITTLLTGAWYRGRAGVFLALLLLTGYLALIDRGLAEASILFVAFIVMTGLFVSPRAGVYSMIAVTALVIFTLGGTTSAGEGLLRTTALLVIVSATLSIGLSSLQREFVRIERTARDAVEGLQKEQSMLEERVEERTAGLARKAEQLRATSYIARRTAEAQDLSSLLSMVTHLITDQFRFYHTGIFLLNANGSHVVLQASSSEGGQRMVERGHSLSVGLQGIVGYAAAQKKPRIALDVGTDAVFFNNPDLPLTRSEVALPLLIRNRILGVLDIQSDRPQAFSIEDIDVLQTLADQVAIAIENARLLDETQAAMMQLEALTSIRTHEAWADKLREYGRAFTYTPLGLRAQKAPGHQPNSIAAPIMLRGQRIGTISIARKSPGRWSRLDQSLLDEVASQVGLAVDNIRLLEEATQRARQEQTVGRLATSFTQSLDLDTLLQTAARELGQLPDVSEVSVLIGQPDEATPAPATAHRQP